jgi:hypothetical protein
VRLRPRRFSRASTATPEPDPDLDYDAEQAAFLVSFWEEKVAWRKAGDVTPDGRPVIRAGGFHHILGDERAEPAWRGNCGRRYAFEMLDDGRTVETTDLWDQGEIPPQFRDALPDNAEVIPAEQPGSVLRFSDWEGR